jgi:pimeloyl-ACP methyl ester carboxylesterase
MRAILPDLTLAYEATGSGRPLLLLHGYPLSRRIWQPQFDGLLDAAWMVAPDLRGHGETEASGGAYSMDLLAQDAAALLDELGITQPVVVGGLSMGGYVALAFWRLFPQRVAGLILAATRAGADTPEARANRDKAILTARDKGAAAIAEAMLPKMLAPSTYEADPGLVQRVRAIMEGTSVAGITGALQGLRDRRDSTPLLAGLDRPVLVIHGQDDLLIPPSEAEATHSRLPRSRLELIPGAGHLLNMEQPASFNAAVRIFLQSL